jgi:hypothetical protein
MHADAKVRGIAIELVGWNHSESHRSRDVLSGYQNLSRKSTKIGALCDRGRRDRQVSKVAQTSLALQ